MTNVNISTILDSIPWLLIANERKPYDNKYIIHINSDKNNNFNGFNFSNISLNNEIVNQANLSIFNSILLLKIPAIFLVIIFTNLLYFNNIAANIIKIIATEE